ncbi:hypothetical protein DIPPA_00438 [Diplonema papillatum]|nr:hypothetical protein DIPPA_00438 [Diplonema papillatum]
MSTGRFVPDEEIEDSFKKVPSVVRSLTPRAAFVAHIDNNGPVPRLAGFCVHGSCQVNPSGAWHEISRRFSSCPRLRSEAIAEADKNTWVDGSLRNESCSTGFWRSMRNVSFGSPSSTFFADLELVKQRAHARGVSTGRFVPDEEIEDSFKKVTSVVRSLTPRAAFVVHIDDNGPVPRLADFDLRLLVRIAAGCLWAESARMHGLWHTRLPRDAMQ